MPVEERNPEGSGSVRPHFSEPPASSDAPQDRSDSRPGADVEDTDIPKAWEELQTPHEFDPAHRDDFFGLGYLGALTGTFIYLGHRFTIRTLTTDEVLAVGLITKDYEGSLGVERAYATAVVAACVEEIDGKRLPTPYKEEGPGHARLIQRFNYVKGQWYPFTIDAVYNQYLELEDRSRAVFNEMGKAFGREAVTPG